MTHICLAERNHPCGNKLIAQGLLSQEVKAGAGVQWTQRCKSDVEPLLLPQGLRTLRVYMKVEAAKVPSWGLHAQPPARLLLWWPAHFLRQCGAWCGRPGHAGVKKGHMHPLGLTHSTWEHPQNPLAHTYSLMTLGFSFQF